MIYYANPSTEAIRDEMARGRLGCIDTPLQGNRIDPAWDVIADNGCFSDQWDADRWWDWLQQHDPVRFAVCPDVVDLDGGETHWPTVDLWHEWAPRIRSLGHEPAFVLHRGATVDTIPSTANVLFIGGDTEWKLGPEVASLCVHMGGRWLHMGRVNSLRRFRTARTLGCDSVDGTHLTFAPDLELPKLLRWIDEQRVAPMLWENYACDPGQS